VHSRGNSTNRQEKILNVHNLPSIEETVRYLHAAVGFPTKETMLNAVRKGFLTSWPGLTVQTVNKYFPESVETQKGHTCHQRKGLRSTKTPTRAANVTDEDVQDLEHQMKHFQKKQRDIFVEVWDEKDIIYTDQTGKFPHTSSRGYKYIWYYYIDGSTILMEPMKSREEKEMIRAHDVLINRLKKQGFTPIKQILDNEISTAYKKAIKAHGLSVERVPKEAHRRNAAEKAIQIAKCNIKSVIAGCDESFPMHLWDRLLPQIEIQMNLLRPANANQNVSAYQYLYTH
jgi:hypothetical protein